MKLIFILTQTIQTVEFSIHRRQSDWSSLLYAAVEDGLQVSLVFTEEGVYVIHPTDELIAEFCYMSDRQRTNFIDLLDDTVENAFEASHYFWTLHIIIHIIKW